jgi:hypothetical protein
MPAGTNYIGSSDLVYTTVYLVKRDGVQQDKYISGDGNRTFIYTPSEGRIYFSSEANPDGENVFVLFKKTSFIPDPIPGVCTGVTIEDSDMPDAVVNVSYSKAFPLNGTAPFTLNVIQKPTWAAAHISLGGVVTVMGFPDVAGPETLEFSVSNCSGITDGPLLKTFTTLANDDNLFISAPSISRITSVTGIPYVISSGSFPVYLSNSIAGIHNDYTGVINVTVSAIIFPKTLRLLKNEVQQEAIAVTSNGSYAFASASYLSTDIIHIILN